MTIPFLLEFSARPSKETFSIGPHYKLCNTSLLVVWAWKCSQFMEGWSIIDGMVHERFESFEVRIAVKYPHDALSNAFLNTNTTVAERCYHMC